jgi:hypothetical protein
MMHDQITPAHRLQHLRLSTKPIAAGKRKATGAIDRITADRQCVSKTICLRMVDSTSRGRTASSTRERTFEVLTHLKALFTDLSTRV